MSEHIKPQSSSKLALITGGSRGLGRAGVLALAKQGTDILFTYLHNEEAAQSLVADIQALGRKAACVQLDTRKTDSFGDFVVTVGGLLSDYFNRDGIDFLLNNAGAGLHKDFVDTTEAEFDDLYLQHLKGPYFLTQALLEHLNDGGHILNVSSGLARFSMPGASAYAVMKGGVEVMSRYMAKELGDRGISVNTLAPGAIATDFNGGTVRDNEALNRFVAEATAKGRVGEASDIGDVIAQLLSVRSSWITGQRIEASGGMFL